MIRGYHAVAFQYFRIKTFEWIEKRSTESCLCWEPCSRATYWVRRETAMKSDGAPLPHDEAFASLIEAGYQVVDGDFDEMTFKRWRQKVIDCISSLMGPDHPYTRSFSEYVRNCDSNGLFLGRGLVDATKREVLMKMKQSGKEAKISR